ncbi:uncharacterized protein LOC119724072 [Patiria miniata]|uniref:Uncharacterized protein n=1 Tax=Patiria miniata TaxID=46514 RepID=A0A913ZIP9_PATMI|nr:uncharacterized protein LOC119724072 [Patiria miniata]
MSVKIILLVVVVAVAVFIVTGGCMMFFTDLFGWKNKGDVDSVNATEGALLPGGDPTLTPDEDGMVGGMFPDHMTDDLKLKLILKALDILKTLDFEDPDYVRTLLPGWDDMTDELKVRLILKAISLLEDKPLTSMFAGHVVAKLKLTLLLKAIVILKYSLIFFLFNFQEVKVDLSEIADDLDDLKFNLVIKALHILKVYRGDFEDTVFNTKSKLHLKLKLTLIYLSLYKSGRRHARDVKNIWPVSEGEVDLDSQSKPSVRVRIDNGALIPEPITPEQTTPKEREIPGKKKKLIKIFKFLKWLPRVLHKKGH